MATHDPNEPLGDGPYRSGPVHRPPETTPKWIYALLASPIILGAFFLWLREQPEPIPELDDVPGVLLDAVAVFPAPTQDLPRATPLDPLLAADQPELLAILEPSPGALRLQRNQPIHVRFNRPMVEGSEVGKPLDESPLVFTPTIRGTTQWSTRSRLIFHADDDAWNRNREARMQIADRVRSLDGSEVFDEHERIVVFDGTPHLARSDQQTVSPGESLPIYFDNPVSAGQLGRDVMAYEIGGGSRSIPFTLTAAGMDGQYFRMNLRPQRRLEEGAFIGVAIAPRWTRWGGGSPSIVRYRIQPPPQITGVDCGENAASYGGCRHGATPGAIVDIGPALRILASEGLADVDGARISVRPTLPEMQVRLADTQRRVLEIQGQWAPDQVYEVRIEGLRTASNRPLLRFSPLAVRSAGHPPRVRLATGRFAWEHDADPMVRFSGIHIGKGSVLTRPVAEGDELLAALEPASYAGTGARAAFVEELGPLAPDARPNRWGEGIFRWNDPDDGRTSNMVVASFRAGEVHEGAAYPTVFAQRSDIALTVRALPKGVLVWATSLETGEPAGDVALTLADGEAKDLASGATGADGVAWLGLRDRDLTEERFAVRGVKGEDRSVIVVEPGSALGPSRLGLTMGGEPPPAGAPRASVFTDRGAYRPGELVRLKAMVRSIHRLEARAYAEREVLLRVNSPSSSVPIAERQVMTNAFGSASAMVSLPSSAGLGTYSVAVVQPATDEESAETILGTSSFRVASFRQPTFRVDVDVPERIFASEALDAATAGTYLFGAPVGNGDVTWSLIREMAAPYPSRWREMTFGPVDGHVQHGTIESGRGRLDDEGRIALPLTAGLTPNRRERLVFEVQIQDRTGQTTAAHRRIELLPAAIEVGVENGDDWVSLGEELTLEAIAIDPDGEPVANVPIRGRIVREGWHSWWEWARGGSGSGYQMRREQRREVVYTCPITSTDEPTGCGFTPERPGTYVLEAELEDAEGRRSLAQRRLYVAGPDETPDRDPPGAPIAVTPTRRTWSVGQEAELAFESPWENAEALITVEQDGVLHYERRHVGAGGQVVRLPLDESMFPNVFVSVALVRPRTAPPGDEVDLHGPDLRFGAAELRVTPSASALEVAVQAPERATPGGEVRVEVEVTGADGPTEVALWMVDEGLLRLTDYETPNPTAGLWPRLSPRFGWDDLRRVLVSRVAPPAHRAGGDGGDGAQRVLRPDEPVLDPVPLWEPQLVTDANGRATVVAQLPERATEYRVIALAIDEGVAWGHAESQVVATRPIVLADALPRFATRGDTFEAAFFVHGTGDDERSVPVSVTVNGEVVHRADVTLRGRTQQRVAVPLEAERAGELEVVFEAGDSRLTRTIPVVPKARWTRGVAIGAVEGEPGSQRNRDVELHLPETEGGRVSITVASHPFVGTGLVAEILDMSPWGGLVHVASTAHALSAQVTLQEGIPPLTESRSVEAHRRRLGHAVQRLLALQSAEGGFGRWAGDGWAYAWENAFGVHALLAADAAGVEVSPDAKARAVAFLRRFVEQRSLSDGSGWREPDAKAYALRVLHEAEQGLPEQVADLFERRDQLSIQGLANLSLALDDDDPRRGTLVADAVDYALVDHEEDESLAVYVRYWDRRASVLGPLLEAAAATHAGIEHAGPVASELLKLAGSDAPFVWSTAYDAAYALRGLAAYAGAFRRTADDPPGLMIDGESRAPSQTGELAARWVIDPREIGGDLHRLRIVPEGDRPVFFAIEGEWTLPLGPEDRVARGRRVSLHRRFETASGRRLRPGDAVGLGEMVRVRLFVFTESENPPTVMLHDPMGGGFEAVQSQFSTTPQNALSAMLGMGPDDDAVDPRGYHAMRSAHAISHRALERNAALFYFDHLPTGLHEYTYVTRATTVGSFTIPPAQMEAAHDAEFLGRSGSFELVVTEEAPEPVVEETREAVEEAAAPTRAPVPPPAPEPEDPEAAVVPSTDEESAP